MDGVKTALGSRGMAVEDRDNAPNIGKEWRDLLYM